MLPLLREAAKIAVAENFNKKNFLLGAIGIRKDGVAVAAKNGAVISSAYEDYRIISDAHAEVRVIRKLGKQGTIYVARVLKKDGTLAMARPCGGCQLRIAAAQVKKVFYTIDENHYGVFSYIDGSDKIYEVGSEQGRISNNAPQSSPRLHILGAA